MASLPEKMARVLIFSVLLTSLALALAYSPEEELLYDTFPDDFLWGSATAAYQVTQTFFHTKNHFASRPDRGRLERGRQGSEHLGRVHQGDCHPHPFHRPENIENRRTTRRANYQFRGHQVGQLNSRPGAWQHCGRVQRRCGL